MRQRIMSEMTLADIADRSVDYVKSQVGTVSKYRLPLKAGQFKG